MWTRAELKERGLAAMRSNYWMAVLASIVLGITSGGGGGGGGSRGGNSGAGDGLSSIPVELIISIVIAALVFMIIGFVVKAFVLNPLRIGATRFFVMNRQVEKASLSELGYGFTKNYMNIVKVMFFMDLYTALWSLLFVIPGIVKSYEYRMIPYLLAEDSSLSKDEAFSRTKAMMTGEKMNAWVLDLSFLGWIILSIFTCGILLVFYVSPYMNCTGAELYAVLRDRMNGNPYGGSTYGGSTYGSDPYAGTYGGSTYGGETNGNTYGM